MTAATPEGGARVLNRAGRERALIDAAGKLFASQGYAATTTREIAAAAGCAEGLISRYFKGKAGLLRALIRVHFDEEVEMFRDDSPAAANLGEELIRRVAWDFDHLHGDRDFLNIIIPQVLLEPSLGLEVQEVGPGRHKKMSLERLGKHEKFRAMPPEEQQALGELVMAIGFMFGFWHCIMGEDPASAKEKALTIARILARAC